MEKELEDIKFRYTFRDYQQEALEQLNKYINDERIHIVAAPGAGKTILALELLLRIGKKSLILVPTIAIKEQWIERLKKDFINGDKENLISSDIQEPRVITVDTYQGLYALKKRKIDVTELITTNNIKTIVFDEAHHLRRTWQKTLKNIIDKLSSTTIISLTATPPYDDEDNFDNYMDLCGKIDAIITIPQLVKSNCLCPHQDFIYFNVPTKEQEVELSEYTKKLNEFLDWLFENEIFIKKLAVHEYITSTSLNTNKILENFEFTIAMLSFLKKVNCTIPKSKALSNLHIPPLDFQMLNILLETVLFKPEVINPEIYEEEISAITKYLTELECIGDNKKINIKYGKKVSNLLMRNSEKLNSICEIIEIEKQTLKEKLKLVVVTDFIKEKYLRESNLENMKELGVMPIFRNVIERHTDINVAVLTGTTTIIPTELQEKLFVLAEKEYGIPAEKIKISPLEINSKYSKVDFEGKYDRCIINLITKLFEQSNISVLIGTNAFIGEGWDAPFVNSLIMATYVASYVTSNQLRGRAIRLDKADKTKFANIWHLVCLEKEDNSYSLGYDYEVLSKRFVAFEGIDLEKAKIDVGINRLNVKSLSYSYDEIKNLNNTMIANSKERAKNTAIWNQSLENYKPISMGKYNTSKAKEKERGKARKNSKYVDTNEGVLRKITKQVILAIAIAMLLEIALTFTKLTSMKEMLPILSFELLIIIVLIVKDFLDYQKYNTYKGLIKIVCNAVCRTLKAQNKIPRKSDFFVNTFTDEIEYGLLDAGTYEEMLFVNSVKESININSSSRYLIEFHGNACAVPKEFDNNKTSATMFFKKISAPNKKLIYTKTDTGKKMLLKYKFRSLER